MSKAESDKQNYSGSYLFDLLSAGAGWLDKNVEVINALNVFPVPDGDTGTNMVLTLKTALREAESDIEEGADKVANSIARGALLGARGNSGVILSQFLKGLAKGLKDNKFLNSSNFPKALAQAARSANDAMSNPVEGTMLTVARMASEASTQLDKASFGEQLMAAAIGAEEAVEKTPEQLDVLRNAGVVDSGGKGLALILRAAANYHLGIALGLPLKSIAPISIDEKWLAKQTLEHWGFCTEFVIVNPVVTTGTIRKTLSDYGDSESLVEGDQMVRVHLHSQEPEKVIQAAYNLGELEQVAIRDMDLQQEVFIEDHKGVNTQNQTGIVSIVTGPGLLHVMRSLGSSAFIWGGATMNPSTQEIVEAVESIPSNDVIILPNNKNTIAACNIAATLTKKNIHTIQTISMTQGISSLLAFNAAAELSPNVEKIEKALATLRWGEVSETVRLGSFENISYEKGENIAILEGTISYANADPKKCVTELIRLMNPEEEDLCTLYYGADTTEKEALETRKIISDQWPTIEVETLYGGQPTYKYLVTLEN